MHYDEFSASLFNNSRNTPTISVDDYNMENIRRKYESRFGPVSWLGSPKSRQLSSAAFYAARYNSTDRYRLIIEVMCQALEKSLGFVLSQVSPEARNMMNRSRQVCKELHRACGFIRFEPYNLGDSGEVLVGKAEFQNNICDLVLKYFARRYGKQPVFVVVKNQVYFLEKNNLRMKDITDVSFLEPRDTFAGMWEAYYDSQSIEGRKNLGLAKKHLPKKYWSWVPEGEKLK